mmetsp:Transcript_20457/g.44405  ORF Transcript_20457/g.44405 Transcript_20457/m.44405 type:complete len:216 (+) Transcript_20457:982-1629(+)
MYNSSPHSKAPGPNCTPPSPSSPLPLLPIPPPSPSIFLPIDARNSSRTSNSRKLNPTTNCHMHNCANASPLCSVTVFGPILLLVAELLPPPSSPTPPPSFPLAMVVSPKDPSFLLLPLSSFFSSLSPIPANTAVTNPFIASKTSGLIVPVNCCISCCGNVRMYINKSLRISSSLANFVASNSSRKRRTSPRSSDMYAWASTSTSIPGVDDVVSSS